MQLYGYDHIHFFIAAFVLLGVTNGLLRAWVAAQYGKKAIEAFQRARANGAGGSSGEEADRIMAEMKMTMKSEVARQEKAAENHPGVKALSMLSTMLMIAFLAYFFNEWMNAVAKDLMETDLGRLWHSGVLGLLAFTGGFVLLRFVATISSLTTNTIGPHAAPEKESWLAVVGDKRSAWAKLQTALLALCFLTVLGSAGAAATRIIMLASSST